MRSLPLLGLALAALAAAATTFACGTPAASDTSVSEGELTGAARKGDEFVRCWTVSDGNNDEFFRDYALTCRVSSKGLPGLSGSSVYVDASGTQGFLVTGTPGDTPDQDVVIGHVRKSAFPLSLHVYGAWAAKRTETVSQFQLTVAAAEAADAAAPVVLKLPFDSWPVTFLNRTPFAVVSATPYTVQAAPFVTESGDGSTKTTFAGTFDSGVLRGPKASFDLLAPPSGGISVEVQTGHGSFHATLASAGVYVIEDSLVRLATADEEAAAAVSSGGSTTSPDAGTSDGASPTPAPTTTCGGPNQAHCTVNGNSICLDGTRLDSNSGNCLPCGNDGQTHCVIDPHNVYGNSLCNAGTRLDSASGNCVACGNDGQTHCVIDPHNVYGNSRCNAGTRLDSNSGNCIACGADGETHCVNDPNNVYGNAICNAGLHSNSSGTCVN
jgi:hypothetical protein